MAEYILPKRWWAIIVSVLFTALIAAAIAALFLFAPKSETPPAAEPAPVITQPAVAEPEPVQTSTSSPKPTETGGPSQSLPTLVEALRKAYPGIRFFQGTWGAFTPASDDLVGQPGVYGAVVGLPAREVEVVVFDGGSAIVERGRFNGFKNTVELKITIEVR